MTRSFASRFGTHPAGLWIIENFISPVDRFVVQISRGRLLPPSSLAVPPLLQTVAGHRTGQLRTVPLVYIRDGHAYVVGNARPAGQRRNPWVANLRAVGRGRIQHRAQTVTVIPAPRRDGDRTLVAGLTNVRPAFSEQCASTEERTVFILSPVGDGDAQPPSDSVAQQLERRLD